MNAKLFNTVRDLPAPAFKIGSGRQEILARKSVLLALAYRADAQGCCRISYRHLAADVGVHMYSVQRAVTELCDLGLLKVEVGIGHASNVYSVTTVSGRSRAVVKPVSDHSEYAQARHSEIPNQGVVTTHSDWGDHSQWLLKEVHRDQDQRDGPHELQAVMKNRNDEMPSINSKRRIA